MLFLGGCSRTEQAQQEAAAQAPAANVVPEFTANGVRPFIVGLSLRESARMALPFDSAAALIGPGCSGRDEVVVALPVKDETFLVMAMANARGQIEELNIYPSDHISTTATAGECAATLGAFAQKFEPRLGAALAPALEDKGVFTQIRAHFPGTAATAQARWFTGGEVCEVTMVYLADLRIRGAGAEPAPSPQSAPQQ